MAEGSDEVVNRVSSSLQCLVCLEILTTPRTLTCLHSFCENCIQSVIDTQLLDTPRALKVSCPSCRKVTNLSAYKRVPRDQLAQKLPLNFTIQNIIEDIQSTKDRQAERMRLEAERRAGIHLNEVEYCRNHPRHKLQRYCSTHNRVLCDKCVKSNHTACQTEALGNVKEEDIEKKSKEIQDNVRKTSAELTRSISVLTRNTEDLVAEIDGYPATIQALEVEMKKLIGKVQQNVTGKSEEAKKKAMGRQKEHLSDCANWLVALDMIIEEYTHLKNRGSLAQRFVTTVNMEHELQMIQTVSESLQSSLTKAHVQQELVEVLKSVIKMGEDMLSAIQVRGDPREA